MANGGSDCEWSCRALAQWAQMEAQSCRAQLWQLQGQGCVGTLTAALAKKLRATAEAGRGNEKGVQRQNPSPPFIGLPG